MLWVVNTGLHVQQRNLVQFYLCSAKLQLLPQSTLS